MIEPTQCQRVLNLFHDHQGVLNTGDFLDNVYLRNEWRARLTDLRRKGFKIESFKVTPKVWAYRLLESQPEFETEKIPAPIV